MIKLWTRTEDRETAVVSFDKFDDSNLAYCWLDGVSIDQIDNEDVALFSLDVTKQPDGMPVEIWLFKRVPQEDWLKTYAELAELGFYGVGYGSIMWMKDLEKMEEEA